MDVLTLGIMAMILTYTWRIQVLWPDQLAPLRLALVATVIAGVAWLSTPHRARRFSLVAAVPLAKVVGWFAILTVVSAVFGLYISNSMTFVRNGLLTTFVFFLLTAVAIRDTKDVERLVLANIIGALVFCVVVQLRYTVGASGRLGNLPSYDANDLAMLLVCTIPLCVYYLRGGAAMWQRVAMGFSLAFFVILLIKTGSRGGFLGLIAVLAYILTTYKTIKLRVRTAVVGVAVATLLLGATDRYWELMDTIRNPTEDYNWSGKSGRGRMEIWKRGVGYMLSRPLTGVGVNNFAFAEGRNPMNAARVAEGKGWIWAAPHNIFVQVGAETGVTGLVLMLLMLKLSFDGLRRLRDRGSGRPREAPTREASLAGALMAGLVGYLVAGFFLTQGYSPLFYSFLGMTVGLLKLQGSEAPVAAPVRPGRRHSATPLGAATIAVPPAR
jgi:O-antigen ligase